MNAKTPSETEIARKAYDLWEAEGRPEGRDVAHWHQAERNITEPVIAPIPEAPPAAPAEEVVADAAAPAEATEDAAAPAAKPRATRARKPKAAEDGTEPAKPRAPRRRKAAEPKA